jgi:hypothetical protein
MSNTYVIRCAIKSSEVYDYIGDALDEVKDEN